MIMIFSDFITLLKSTYYLERYSNTHCWLQQKYLKYHKHIIIGQMRFALEYFARFYLVQICMN